MLNCVYLLGILLASPILLFRALFRNRYRQGISAKLLGQVPVRRNLENRCIWFHAVSVGEVNCLAPIIAEIEEHHPEWECVISTTTRTGYELARQRYAPRIVFYAPLDFTWAVSTALNRIQPDVLALVELELWPNLINTAKSRGTSVVLLNGRMSDSSFRGYRRFRWFFEPIFGSLRGVGVQSQDYAQRFEELGVAPSRIHTTGSIKFDNARTDRAQPDTRRLRELFGIQPEDIVFLAGSTQSPEEAAAINAFRQLSEAYPSLRLIVVPRHPERFNEVAKLLDRHQMDWIRRSQLIAGKEHSHRVLLVDVVGELPAWWGTADIGYVGGSWGSRGGQNMIEPAAFGVAVSFGHKTHNFRDVVQQLLAHDAAIVVSSEQQMLAFVRLCLEDPQKRETLGSNAQKTVLAQQGATSRTLAMLEPIFQEADEASDGAIEP